MLTLRPAALSSMLALVCAGLASCATVPQAPPAEPRPSPTYEPHPPQQPPVVSRPDTSDQQPVLVGTVIKVTDGDTIRVQLSSGPVSVRFDSIDAPEKDQPWGSEAQQALAGRLDGQVVALDVVEQDRYERLVAVVFLGSENVNGWMVKQGHAWAYRQYLHDKDYCAWEGIARATRLGLWSLPAASSVAPWEWRQAQRDDTKGFTDYSREAVQDCIASMRKRTAGSTARTHAVGTTTSQSSPVGHCLIKGNISQSGRIYHVPGSPSYESTQIDESKGERWFCSEQEAQAAGWRAPRR